MYLYVLRYTATNTATWRKIRFFREKTLPYKKFTLKKIALPDFFYFLPIQLDTPLLEKSVFGWENWGLQPEKNGSLGSGVNPKTDFFDVISPRISRVIIKGAPPCFPGRILGRTVTLVYNELLTS